MNPGTVFGILPLILSLFGAPSGLIAQSVSKLTFQDEIIVRVPIVPRRPETQFERREHKGPKCIPTEMLRRAILSGAGDQVDFVLSNHVQLRAELDEDCPALDFYDGLYLQTPDDRVCAGRDEIHSRMGGSCPIDRFVQLTRKGR